MLFHPNAAKLNGKDSMVHMEDQMSLKKPSTSFFNPKQLNILNIFFRHRFLVNDP